MRHDAIVKEENRLRGDAGQSAETLHTLPELLGLFYAEPYVQLPHAGGFILARRQGGTATTAITGSNEEELEKENDEEAVVGYTLFAFDTREFEETLESQWFHPLRAKYPKDTSDADTYKIQLTEADKQYVSLLHAPGLAPDACVAFSPAHLHVDILPEAQRQGWGRRLLDAAVRFLRDEKGLTSVWLGYDPKNTDAARFYERLGFKPIEGAPSNYVGLKFEDWTFA
ncbi:uncharacterized protein FOMMEDRAFT_142046 [Fomitiporia mediterranea MF3/22]|uniref:uncharacterized protein n=1 Tax=Fomitiporia mediterranea (strain MF3/22) TaxID=694068 RepID=UPI000440919C|nr:uncharacterized protein FOMMEDRAFT_142046 [Fomitiporia mediterranea MF3/22]EJD01417.1 hypothetical protein FOMMEDRAFT_142046 [Fomitiporia mediterranea MF3/22]